MLADKLLKHSSEDISRLNEDPETSTTKGLIATLVIHQRDVQKYQNDYHRKHNFYMKPSFLRKS